MRTPCSPPQIPGKTEAGRTDNALRRTLTVPKAEFIREGAPLGNTRKGRKRGA